MDKPKKERLEQELRFLKESLEAEIISKDEYEKGKERIGGKLKEIEEKREDETKEETKKDSDEEEIIIKEIPKEERVKIETKEEQPEKEEEKEEVREEPKKEEAAPEREKRAIGTNKKIAAVAVLIILILVSLLFFKMQKKEETPAFQPVCITDNDCRLPVKIGACINPNTTEAKCEFKDDVKVQLTVLNDKNCASCGTTRLLSIIKQLLPGAEESSVDYNSAEGKKLADELSIVALPAYIFDENITNAHNYNKIKNTLTKKNNKYLMSNAASGADYYFKRDKIPKKLDLYLIQGSSGKAEINAKEVLDLFKDDIDFTKHVITDKGKLKQELGITTYPAFLVNNQIKFSGVQAAETIKEKFCGLNELEECSVKLSTDIK